MNKQIAFVDVETTGLSSENNEVIEIGIMLGEYKNNRIVGITDQYSAFQEPFFSISPRITQITGITNNMVSGKLLDLDKVFKIMQKADAIVAHNAGFDRGFIAKLLPEAIEFDWYCSVRQIKWKQFGFENGKLQQLLYTQGIQVENAHRAYDDAINLAHLLNTSNSKLEQDQTYLSFLMAKNPIKKPVRF